MVPELLALNSKHVMPHAAKGTQEFGRQRVSCVHLLDVCVVGLRGLQEQVLRKAGRLACLWLCKVLLRRAQDRHGLLHVIWVQVLLGVCATIIAA